MATPSVSFTYDPDYLRPLTMTDGIGTTTYNYVPIAVPPVMGAGNVASVDGPFANDTITYAYDELGRPVQTSINGVSMLDVYDAAGRVVTKTNALGSFSFSYEGGSTRLISKTCPNGQTTTFAYSDGLHDRRLQQITHTSGATPISQFSYVRDIPRQRITSWSQQAGAQPPSVFTLGYDAVNQILSAAVTNSGSLVNRFAYTYDLAGNRLTESIGVSNYTATHNALNQLVTTTAPVGSRTNEWDAVNRLVAVSGGNQRTEFTYDGLSRLSRVRQTINGSEVSNRRFVWCNGRICEERDASGAVVVKRYFPQGVKLETGPKAGAYYYSRDHLGSVRELTDGSGAVRARYSYDPVGRRTKVGGDLDSDFGFAGMFFSSEASLALTHFRAYDSEVGRWLSRDPLSNAEVFGDPNLYAYAANNPVNLTDPLGLQAGGEIRALSEAEELEQYLFGSEAGEMESGGEIRQLTEVEELEQYLFGNEAGEIREVSSGEIRELTEEEMWQYLEEHGQIQEVTETTVEGSITPRVAPRTMRYPGFTGAAGEFIGAGFTILTMTDCNTVNGILGLVRQGKGGLLNYNEDQQMKQIEQYLR
jgi:RHS repeat-associated protein